MRKPLIACALLLWGGILSAQSSDFIRYFPPVVPVTSSGSSFFAGGIGLGNTLASPYANLYGDAANTLAQRDGTAAQTFNVYNSFTTAGSNYGRFAIVASATGTDLIGQGAGATIASGAFRSLQGSVSKTLTDAAAATPFMTVAVPTDDVVAGSLKWTAKSVTAYVAASGIYTYTDANLPAANDTVVVTDGTTPKTYTYKATVAVEGDILIGTADATILNLVQALNKSGGTNGAGGDYLVAAINPLVSATQDTTGAGTGTMTVTARTAGTRSNAINLNETSAGAAFFPSAALTSGAGDTLVRTGSFRFAGATQYVTPVCTIDVIDADLVAYSGAAPNTLVCTWSNVVASQTCALSVTCTNNLVGTQVITVYGRADMEILATLVFP